MFPGPKRDPGNDRGTDRNRRVSSPLSPIFSLFLAPTGILYQKVQHLLSEEERAEGSPPPAVIRAAAPRTKAAGRRPSRFSVADGAAACGGAEGTAAHRG